VKTVGKSEFVGYDGGKKVNGRKRHIVVDILGNLLSVLVDSARIHDTKRGGIIAVSAKISYPSLMAFLGDQGYLGTAVEYCKRILNLPLHISKRITDHFSVLPKRWIVERTFAWFNSYRRLSKDFEGLTDSAENMIRIAMIRRTLYALTSP
jgi:putative transposase|tara:strand:- start:32 stop:484 length:453 start_codon:yes stop_codon:yes gene_type:complete